MKKKAANIDFLNEMTSLNNELINTQRILVKKNLEITRLNAQLKAANTELEQFSYAASHDLKEPLRMVNSFMEKLQKQYARQLDDKANKYIDFAVDGSRRMMTMINELLQFAKAGHDDMKKEITDVNEVIQEVLKMQDGMLVEKGAVVTVAFMPKINAFKTPLKILFQNLVSNGIKYVPLHVNPIINISVAEKTDCWQFAVADNGIGISPGSQTEIFHLFKRLHSQATYPGTGMGLAICEKIVQRHGGKIWVESEEGKGSTFYFTLLKD